MKWRNFFKNFDIGGHSPLKIRYEEIQTGLNISVRLMFLSDLHLNTFKGRRVLKHVYRAANSIRPQLILLGGDLVDHQAALPLLQEMIKELKEHAPLYAIGGNHDRWVGWEKVKEDVIEAGAKWLNNDYTVLELATGKRIVLEGEACPEHNEEGYRVHLAHHPDDFQLLASQGVDLMLSGHLHGCQVVTHQRGEKLYPGALFYKWNGLKFHEDKSTLVVSRGVSDTLPIRWNCPREVVLCHLF